MEEIRKFNVNSFSTNHMYTVADIISKNDTKTIRCFSNIAYNSSGFTIYNGSNINTKKFLIMTKSSYMLFKQYTIDKITTIDWNSRTNGCDFNFINTITIGENFVALSFINSDKTQSSNSSLVFTRTAKDNLCVIFPSSGCLAQEFNKNGGDTTVVRLYALTNMTNSTYITSYQPYVAFKDNFTVLTPVLVNGDDDYCPHVFYTPSTEVKLDQSDDAIIDYNGKQYWYNGFIAVEI